MRQTLRSLNAEDMAVAEVAGPVEVVAEASMAAVVEVAISPEAEATFQAAEGV